MEEHIKEYLLIAQKDRAFYQNEEKRLEDEITLAMLELIRVRTRRELTEDIIINIIAEN